MHDHHDFFPQRGAGSQEICLQTTFKPFKNISTLNPRAMGP